MSAQLGAMMRKDFDALKSSTMLFIRSGNVQIDSTVESFLSNEWNFIPYRVINSVEQKQFIGNPKYSFMTFITQSFYEQSERVQTTCLYVITTTEKDVQTSKLDVTGNRAGYIVFDDDRNFEDGGSTFSHKLPDLLRALQHLFKYSESKGFLSSTVLEKDYVNNRGKLVDHTLLIESNLIEEAFYNDEKAFEEYYPASFEIAEASEVKRAIDEKKTKFAYLYIIRDAGALKRFIIEAGTGEVLWYDFEPTDKVEVEKLDPSFFKIIKLKKFVD